MKFFFKTYGCTFNKSNSDIIYPLIKDKLTDDISKADYVIINTCGVKEQTEKSIINEIKRINKKIFLLGCLPYIRKDLLKIPELRGKDIEIFGLDLESFKKRLIEINGEINENVNRFLYTAPIARIPISTGCLMNCSYCATKFVFGRLKSKSEREIIDLIKLAISSGALEIQLTGQDLGCYGFDIGTNLSSLLRKIAKLDGKFKVRVGMINPAYLDAIPNEIFTESKFYHFLHLPVQSGSNDVLLDMKRTYKIEKIENFIEEKRREFDFTFETDIIVGYPTEKEKDFFDTIKFIKETKPDVVNVTKFSKRPGTEASKLKELNSKIVKKRSKEISDLVRKISYEKNLSLVGKKFEVLIQEKGENCMKGRNECYKQVILKGDLKYDFYNCKVISATVTSLIGELEIGN